MTITLVCGPMYSGKTSFILNYEKRCVISNRRYVLINHSLDKRYSEDRITTHDQKQSINKFISTNKLTELDVDFTVIDVIIIDECQFFDDLSIFLDKWSNKTIICSGLNSDFKLNSFKNTNDAFSRADKIIHLVSTCSLCGEDAPFSKRLTKDEQQTVIGNDIYSPRCRKCFSI